MNFARHQAQADRTARRLIWLHALASLAVVIGINAAAALIWQLLFGAAPYPKGFFLTNTLVVSGLIVYVSLYPFRFIADGPALVDALRSLSWARAGRGDRAPWRVRWR